MRNIEAAAEIAQMSSTAITVPLQGEIRLKVPKIMVSQKTSTTKNSIGNELCPICSKMSQRPSEILSLICTANRPVSPVMPVTSAKV